jgi:hypothetical protein
MDIKRFRGKNIQMAQQAAGIVVICNSLVIVGGILHTNIFKTKPRGPQARQWNIAEEDFGSLGQSGVEQRLAHLPEQSPEKASKEYPQEGPKRATEQVPLATPRMIPGKKKVDEAAQPHCMAKNVYDFVENEIRQKPWVKDKFVRVNKETNTISLFDTEDTRIDEISPMKIPLFFHGIPIIPHDYKNFSTDICPIEFDALETSPSTIGLLKTQLNSLYRFIPGIEHVDFYVDREVVITVADALFELAIEKLGSRMFRAWKCNCRIIPGRHFTRGFANRNVSDDGTCVSDISSPIKLPPYPGQKIYNSDGYFSTLGVLLHSGSLTKEIELNHFTVSAHSFLRKMELGFRHPNLLSVTVAAFVSHVVWVGGRCNWFEPLFLKQYFFFKMFILVFTAFWECPFKPLGMNTTVHTLLLYLTFSRAYCDSRRQSQHLALS